MAEGEAEGDDGGGRREAGGPGIERPNPAALRQTVAIARVWEASVRGVRGRHPDAETTCAIARRLIEQLRPATGLYRQVDILFGLNVAETMAVISAVRVCHAIVGPDSRPDSRPPKPVNPFLGPPGEPRPELTDDEAAELRAAIDQLAAAVDLLSVPAAEAHPATREPARIGRPAADPDRNAAILRLWDSGMKNTAIIARRMQLTKDQVKGVLYRAGRRAEGRKGSE